MSKRKKEENTITVHVDLTEKPERWPKIVAYLLTRTGRLLTRQEFRPDKEGRIGEARLSVEEIQKAYTLKIGPDVDEVNRLERYRPYVKTFELAEEVTIEIPKEIWICWLKSPYLVTGTVKKVLPGKLAPICVGEVEIFDVDMRHCILRLPDHIIEKIRDGIIDIIVDPPPIDPRIIWKDKDLTWWGPDDDDWCGTGPKPPFPPKAVDVREKLQSLPKEWSFAVKRYDRLTDTKTMANIKLQSLPPQERTTFLNSMAVEGVTTSQVLYSNTKQFRDLLIDKLFYFKYWICWWPWIFWLWWPYCGYSLELLGTVTLNPDGSFSKNVWLSVCRQDKPDLWFTVKQTIDGVERIIYARYPVPCNTYWNHPSGDPVDLLVSHPFAETCVEYIPGIPDPYVMPMGVYEDEWYQVQDAHIKAHCDPSTPLPATCGLYGGTDPYGTRLDLRMQFHDAMYGYYYRWSYRRHGETNWVPLNTPITHRHVTWSSGKWVIVADNLGPMNVGSETGLYKVPDPSKAWLSNRDDLAYAIWNTAVWDGSQYLKQVSDGKYDLRLEMFNAGGSKVTPSAAGFKYILPTAALGDVDDALYVEAGGELIMHLHVDNTDTVAEISSVSLNGAAAGECQFLEYKKKDTDNVEIEYVAYHPATPENFLSHYVLSVTRGISGTLVQSITSSTPERTPIEAVYTVGDLLGSFDQCAFSVWLHTYPRTRDGHSRIREYEDSDRSSFALTKNKGPP